MLLGVSGVPFRIFGVPFEVFGCDLRFLGFHLGFLGSIWVFEALFGYQLPEGGRGPPADGALVGGHDDGALPARHRALSPRGPNPGNWSLGFGISPGAALTRRPGCGFSTHRDPARPWDTWWIPGKCWWRPRRTIHLQGNPTCQATFPPAFPNPGIPAFSPVRPHPASIS